MVTSELVESVNESVNESVEAGVSPAHYNIISSKHVQID